MCFGICFLGVFMNKIEYSLFVFMIVIASSIYSSDFKKVDSLDNHSLTSSESSTSPLVKQQFFEQGYKISYRDSGDGRWPDLGPAAQ